MTEFWSPMITSIRSGLEIAAFHADDIELIAEPPDLQRR